MGIPQPSSPADPSILWLGPLSDHSGYADEARGFLRALEQQGHRPAARELRWRDSDLGVADKDRDMLREQNRRMPRDPVVAVHHYVHGHAVQTVEGAVNVARTMFETDRLPAAWLPRLLERDEIWVPSHHNLETFHRSGIPASKLRFVGETIDFDLFAPGVEPLALREDDGEFVFVTNFDFGERKAWRTLIRAWARAFERHDPVRLVLKTDSYLFGVDHVTARIDAFLRAEGLGGGDRTAPITVMTETLRPEDMPRLYAGADAYVLTSHGEGWGRPYMEAMAMGLPTIASRHSGTLEFMSDATSWLVDGELVPVPEGDPYFGMADGHLWFQADVDELVATLREVAGDPDAARLRASGARADLIERWGAEAICEQVLEAARAAAERHGAHRRSHLVMRGTFGSGASLAVVNDAVGDGLAGRGWRVGHRGRGAGSKGELAIGFSHGWPPEFSAVTDGPTVVCLPWEYGAPPAEWVEQARTHADRVWVPSAYVRDGYVAAGMPPGIVEVVPNGVDTAAFRPDGARAPLPRTAGCVFLFVGGTIWRKGVDRLLSAWTEAFGPSDDVVLVVKDFGTTTFYQGQTQQEQLRALSAREDIAPIVYLEDELAPDQLPELYRAADVLVVPYRGEGFCLPALEAMACGRPVIHTGAGPTGEFVPADAGWALPSRRVALDPGSALPPLAGEGVVLEVDHDALVATLREAAASDAERRRRGEQARRHALDHSWERIAERAERSLVTLADERLPLAREIVPAAVDGHDDTVLFAPDWSRAEEWVEILDRWVTLFGPEDPVTLALHVPAEDAEAVAGRVLERLETLGHAEDALPDLAVCESGGATIAALVAGASAVLLPPGAAERPELTRRASRVLRGAGDLEAYRASVTAAVPA